MAETISSTLEWSREGPTATRRRVLTSDDPKDDVAQEVSISVSLPAVDGFLRSRPAELEGPEDAWRMARAVVDYGCAILAAGGTLRSDRRIRDAVLAALLRRLLITAESTIVLLGNGLIESAMSQTRTLLDIELAFRLIHRDPSDRFAKRLAAFHYLTYQEHGQDMLGNRETRDRGSGTPDGALELIAITKSYARFLEAPVFDEVRNALKNDRFWHGFRSVEDAFREIGYEHDYLTTYDSTTWFVHAVNVDHDFAGISETGLTLKPVTERNPSAIQPLLGHTALRSVEIIALYLKDTGFELDGRVGSSAELCFEDGTTVTIRSLDALRMFVLRQFDVPDRTASQRAL